MVLSGEESVEVSVAELRTGNYEYRGCFLSHGEGLVG
jgi:hypothetical protein